MKEFHRLLASASARACLTAFVLALPATAALADPPQRTITVSGEGEALGTPNSAHISAGVTTQATTAAEALARNSAAMNNVFAALKGLGIADKDIQTSDFSVQPQYAPYNSNSTDTQHIVGYQVSNQVNVALDSVSRVGPTIDALVAAGANQMNSIAFTIKDSKALLDRARTEAVDDAVARAEVLTRAAHVTLGPILSIQESGGEGPRPVMFAMARMAAPAPTPVAAGQQSISAGVAITWEFSRRATLPSREGRSAKRFGEGLTAPRLASPKILSASLRYFSTLRQGAGGLASSTRAATSTWHACPLRGWLQTANIPRGRAHSPIRSRTEAYARGRSRSYWRFRAARKTDLARIPPRCGEATPVVAARRGRAGQARRTPIVR